MLPFSIVIPTYNYARYLPRALESALAQAGQQDEIIVVDDGSTDGTARLLANYNGGRSRRLRCCFQPHRGLAAARNHGIRLSTGSYLLFLDADDALFPDALKRLRGALEAEPDKDFVIAGRVTVDTRGRASAYRAQRPALDRKQNFSSFLLDSLIPVVNGSALIHRRVFSRLQFPESVRLWEDRVFHAQLLALFDGTAVAEPTLTMYRHRDSLSHNADVVLEDGVKTVDLIFDPAVLPPDFFSLRAAYAGKIHLEMFQMCYSRRRYDEALGAFAEAFRSSPRRAMNVKHLRRYLKIGLVRSLRHLGLSEAP
jgi:glycosyltransferase involved in cell wall biosynthesis